MNDPFSRGVPPRFWRQDDGALAAGVCAGLAEDLDLPLPLVRLVTAIFLILPTGLAYLALAMLLRRRQPQRRRWNGTGRLHEHGPVTGSRPSGEGWILLRNRFELLEPRVGRIEAFVTAPDFELHRGFRGMRD